MKGRFERIGSFGIKGVIFLAAVCLFFALSGAQAVNDLNISVSWTDREGVFHNVTAQSLPYEGYEDAYWVRVDRDAFDSLTLNIFSMSDMTLRFFPENNSLLTGVIDAGDDLLSAPWIGIDSVDEHAGEIGLRLYVSSVTDMPASPGNGEDSAVPVTVSYRDETTYMEILQSARVFCPRGGSAAVYAEDIPGYRVVGDSIVTVLCGADGSPNPSEITFVYRSVMTGTDGKAVIGVKYLDESNGTRLMDDGTCECSYNNVITVTAADIPGYSPLNTTIDVFVDTNGVTSPSEVVFYYRMDQVTTVTVHYIDIYGNSVGPDAVIECEKDSRQVIRAGMINGYTVEGPDTVTVTVDASGVPDISETAFVYRAIGPVDVTVRYLNAITGQDISEAEVVSCPTGQTTVFSARIVTGYILTGENALFVEVGPNGEIESNEVCFYYTTVEAPTVRVSYLFEDGSHAAEDDEIPCPLNSETPISARNLPGYTVIGESVRTVTVDGSGNMEPDSIRFVYQPSSEPVVSVRYIDRDTQEDVLPPETISCAINTGTAVQAPQVNGYTLYGQAARYVYVDAQGKADTEEIVFNYIADTVPQVVWVRVAYREISDGTLLYSTTEPCDAGGVLTVYADTSLVPAEYELSDDARKTYSAGTDGEGTEVVFWFRKKEVNMITIPVFYRDDAGRDVASAGIAELVEGNNAIYAQPLDLLPYYVLTGDNVQYVVMDETGQVSRSEVIFSYLLTVTPSPSPAPTTVPYAVGEDAFYAHATKDGIYFRSSPGTSSMENVIRSVKRSEVIFVYGSLYNELGEKWYRVDIDGVGGFINANVITAMDQDEINAVFGFTPTPVPTEIPDGAPIERWGKVNSKRVAFRKGTSTSASVIDRLDKNTSVWIYQSVTDGGVQWYRIRSSGTDGYIMKDYVDLLSEKESAEYQSALRTPMATRTPDPTRMATTEVTSTPVPTPGPTVDVTPAPTASPTAVPYFGYAVTRDRTRLFNEPGGRDENVTAELEAESLVLIMASEYAEGELWDSVELVGVEGTENTGFILDSDLMYITNDMVGQYLVVRHVTSQPTVIPTQVPQQKFGFALTVGGNVALRAYADTNAQIYSILSKDSVVVVNGQEYTDGQVWDLVNQGSLWGYIRDDQLRMLSDEEVVNYLESLRTPTPVPEATPTAVPVTGNSLTSYGYVTTDKVNMRRGDSRSSESIRLLEKYAFALVLGTRVNTEGETWYQISQSGTEGFIMANYFKVLSMDELTAFLTSDEYLNAADNTSRSTDISAGNIQALEDYNRGVWQNPAVSVSYEPFTVTTEPPADTVAPKATATPTPRSTYGIGGVIGTPQVSASAAPQNENTEKKESGTSAAGLILAGASAALFAGGVYIYHLHRKNERRRRAVRQQQARRAERANTVPRTTRAPGYNTRGEEAASDGQTRRMDHAPFMPPSGAPDGTIVKKTPAADPFGDGKASGNDVFGGELDGTRSYPARQQTRDSGDGLDPWRKRPEAEAPGGSAREEGPGDQSTRIVEPVKLQKDTAAAGGSAGGVHAGSGEPPAGETDVTVPVRHRRSDRHRNREDGKQTGQTSD